MIETQGYQSWQLFSHFEFEKIHRAKSTTLLEEVVGVKRYRGYSNGLRNHPNIHDPLSFTSLTFGSSLSRGNEQNNHCPDKGDGFTFGLGVQMISLWGLRLRRIYKIESKCLLIEVRSLMCDNLGAKFNGLLDNRCQASMQNISYVALLLDLLIEHESRVSLLIFIAISKLRQYRA